MKTAYATKRTPILQAAVTETFGPGALVAGTPNVNPSSRGACWPFDPATHEVIGLAMAQRSGPTFTVVRARGRSLTRSSPPTAMDVSTLIGRRGRLTGPRPAHEGDMPRPKATATGKVTKFRRDLDTWREEDRERFSEEIARVKDIYRRRKTIAATAKELDIGKRTLERVIKDIAELARALGR